MLAWTINTHSLSLLSPAISVPTIASIREETVKSVTIALEEPAECPEFVVDYIIQYEGRSISTSGALSVVIEDVVFCQQPNITFNVTAVLRDGSLIDGCEFDFTQTGESKHFRVPMLG